MSQIIQVKPCSLPEQEILSIKEYTIELFETYFTIRMVFKALEPQTDEHYIPDRSLPKIEVDSDFEMLYPRNRFAGLEKVWIQKIKRWKIVVNISGIGMDIKLYFKHKVDCVELYNRLKEYFIPPLLP